MPPTFISLTHARDWVLVVRMPGRLWRAGYSVEVFLEVFDVVGTQTPAPVVAPEIGVAVEAQHVFPVARDRICRARVAEVSNGSSDLVCGCRASRTACTVITDAPASTSSGSRRRGSSCLLGLLGAHPADEGDHSLR